LQGGTHIFVCGSTGSFTNGTNIATINYSGLSVTGGGGNITASGLGTFSDVSSNTFQYKYTTIPTITSSMIGYTQTSQITVQTTFTNNALKNMTSLTLVAGIYSITYSITYLSSTTTGTGFSNNVPITYGISSSSSAFASSSPCCYYSVNQAFNYVSANYQESYIMSNSLILNTTTFNSLVVYLNILIGSNSIPPNQGLLYSIQSCRIA
jgi:hypothetical protein